jgi:tRNA dimethylallyltransferase
MKNEKLVVILGPTATGKSKIGILLAQAVQGEIISGDSMLVYQHMDIGTAKPSAEDLQKVPHHLIDILPPGQEFSVVDFKQKAEKLITEINKRGHLPILVGGTGLYIRALLENYEFSSAPSNTELRLKLAAFADENGDEALFAKLKELDPYQAEHIDSHDRRRMIRAIETAQAGEHVSRKAAGKPVYQAAVFGLTMDRAALYAKINARVDMMLKEGLEAETKKILAMGVQPEALCLRSIGYRQMVQYLQGAMSYEETVAKIKQATRNFAKRQFTWYKKMPYVVWYNVDTDTRDEIVKNMQRRLVEKYNLL